VLVAIPLIMGRMLHHEPSAPVGTLAGMCADAVIRSKANQELKRVGAALAGRERDLLVLEGDRLVDEARTAGLVLELVLVSEAREERAVELERAGLPVRRVDPALMDRVSALVTSPGVLALGRRTDEGTALELAPDALVLVVAGVADPGNLGALARSAEAAGASALCVLDGGASPWNPKALRGSAGSLLRLAVRRFPDVAACTAALGGTRHVRAATRGAVPLADFDWSGPVAIWVGSETGELPAACDPFEGVSIPMRGRVESLNVTVAASLLLYASGRA